MLNVFLINELHAHICWGVAWPVSYGSCIYTSSMQSVHITSMGLSN